MAREDFERDLVSALASLEDARAEMLRAYDDVERLDVQLGRAGREVEQMVEMTRRGGWDDDADFALMVLQDSGSTGREVAVSLADTGITRDDLDRRLLVASRYVTTARESLAAAEVRVPANDALASDQITTVRNLLSMTSQDLDRARSEMRTVDVSVAAAQAHLSGPFASPEVARSMATGADLHLENATVTTTHMSGSVDQSRDEVTHAARAVADQLQGLQTDQRSGVRPERSAQTARVRHEQPHQHPPARGGPRL